MSQLERLHELARQGVSKAEAIDREGVSEKKARDALAGTDLKWGPKRTWRPYGLEGRALVQFCSVIGSNLGSLRDVHSFEEVGAMTGMNNGQQATALECKEVGLPYNYTLGNIARIAEARGKTFAELIGEAVAPMKGLENAG